MSDSIFKHYTYGQAVKTWNEEVFGKSMWAMPRKGYSGYNQVQDIRHGKEIAKPSTIADLKKVEDPKKIEKPKPEPKKAEPKVKRKTKEEKEAEIKAKAEKKEKNVKNVISGLMKDSVEKKDMIDDEKNKYPNLFKIPKFNKTQKEKMEQKAKEEQEEAKVDKQKVMKEYGKNGENIPSQKLFYTMASNGVKDSLDFEENAGGITGFSAKELKYTFPDFYSQYEDFLKNDYPLLKKQKDKEQTERQKALEKRQAEGKEQEDKDKKEEQDAINKELLKMVKVEAKVKEKPKKVKKLTAKQEDKLTDLRKQYSALQKPVSGSTSMYYRKEMALRNKIQEIENKLL